VTEQESVVVTEKTYTDSEIERAKEAIDGMTPPAYLQLESALSASQDVIPEAGGIVWVEFVGKHGGVMHTTARATHPVRCAQMIFETLDYLRSLQPEVGWKVEEERTGGAPKSTPVQSVQQAPAPVVESVVQQPEQFPSITDPKEPQYVDIEQTIQPPPAVSAQSAPEMLMDIVKIEIAPRPDARVDLNFFAEGRKWPDLRIVNWTAQSVLDNIVDPALGWSIETLSAAKIMQGNMKVRWVTSDNLNTKGEPYKDVKHIGLA
jgi:hypothetical protein